MINLNELQKTSEIAKKRIGRGGGSGRGGHTSTRGHKGQRARGSIGLLFEGTKYKKSFIKKFPLLRGKGKFTRMVDSAITINLSQLADYKVNEIVDIASLQAKKILSPKVNYPVKVLGFGDITKALTVTLPCSASAKLKIEKAGGQVIPLVTKSAQVEASSPRVGKSKKADTKPKE